MKLCPNPACPHRVRKGYPAEFLDRAETCSDCTMPLVDEKALASAQTEQAVAAWHAEREENASSTEATPDGARRLDVITGWTLIALSIALLAGSLWLSAGGGYVVAVGPFVYGVYRLTRAPAKSAGAAKREGPYR